MGKVGENVIIKECNKKKKKQLCIFSDCYVRSNYDSSVCITASETRSDDLKGRILLQPCEDDSKIQKFRTFKTDASDKFQFKMLKPKNNKLCLTQEGRPDAGEELRFTTCEKAGNNGFDDTSYWVVGTFNGHPTTKENKKKAKKKSNPPTKPPSNPPTNPPSNPPTNSPSNPPKNPPSNQPTNSPSNPPTNPPSNL